MFRIIISLDNPSGDPFELTGLSKRVNAIGLQPIPGDQFKYEDLNREDKEKINGRGTSIKNLIVKSREFKFENTYAAINPVGCINLLNWVG